MSSTLILHNSSDFSGSASSATTVAPTFVGPDGVQGIKVWGFNQVVVHVSGTFAATYRCQYSMDGTTWYNGSFVTTTSPGAAAGQMVASGTASGVILLSPVQGKYFRFALSAYTSGTIVASGYATTQNNAPYVNFAVLGAQFTNVPDSTVGASTTNHIISAASTNATVVKASAGTINLIVVGNTGAGNAFFKIYQKATAPTVGTDTPVATILIGPNQTVEIPCGPHGWRITTGIGYAITGGAAVADTTAVLANQVVGTINYT
jgi:hypothetical protein